MTTQPLATKTPSQISSSSLSTVHNIGSLPVTDVLNGNTLQGPEKSSADAMQTVQMQQTQPVIVPTLSPSRVNTSIADDLDALLDETLDEFCMRDASSSSSSVQSTAGSSLSSFLYENGFHVALIENLIDMEKILVKVAELGTAAGLGAVDWMKGSTNDVDESVQQINKTIEMINLCFKSLLQSDNPSTWLEQASKTIFYRNCHLFAASYFLITTIDQEISLMNLLDSKLIAEWKDNYQNCVILLKKYGLDQYNETEFPFSEMGKFSINMIKALFGNDAIKNIMTEMMQNPQLQEKLKKDMKAFNEDPEKMIAQMMTPNPQLAEMMKGQTGAFGNGDPMAMMAEMAQNPQFAEMMKGQMGAFGNGDPMAMMAEMAQNPQFAEMMKRQMEGFGKGVFAETEKKFKQQIPTLISFFQKLDQVLTQNSENAEAVEEWLNEALKLTYQYPFFRSKSLLMRLPVDEKDSSTNILNSLSESCCRRLSTLGLQKYIDEAPPKEAMDALRQMAVIQKENLQLEMSMSLSFLRPLAIELKKLNFTSEECSANRQVIEDWMTGCKKTESYYAPFVTGLDLCEYREAFEEVLDKKLLDELNQLLPFCRDRLLKLGLSTYVFEMPQIQGSTDDIICINPKKTLSDTERFKNEFEFFKAMIKQEDEALDQWLKETSPNFDYPLLWANKRLSRINHIRDVDLDLRRDWSMCADVCIERVKNSGLNSHLEITENASPELKAFLT
jgi:hypothetical protein